MVEWQTNQTVLDHGSKALEKLKNTFNRKNGSVYLLVNLWVEAKWNLKAESVKHA